MGVRFAIRAWAACAPGLVEPAEWRAWASTPVAFRGEWAPALSVMPAMQRRRLTTLGRAAAQVAWDCHTPSPDVPVVFASGHGDAARCLDLLKEFAATGAASPTEFTFSVHNAIGAMYSIARGDSANYTSVAAGPDSAPAGIVEACALLADGAPEVLLVCYEAPLPGEYFRFQREPAAAFAWAWRLAAPADGEPFYQLEWSPEAGEHRHDAARLHPGLEPLRFALAGESAMRTNGSGRVWTWSRHA